MFPVPSLFLQYSNSRHVQRFRLQRSKACTSAFPLPSPLLYTCCQPFNVHVGTLARASTTPTPIKGIDQLSDILEVKRVIARGVTVTYWVECCLSGRLEDRDERVIQLWCNERVITRNTLDNEAHKLRIVVRHQTSFSVESRSLRYVSSLSVASTIKSEKGRVRMND